MIDTLSTGGIGAALNGIGTSISGMLGDLPSIGTRYKPFTSDNDEVSNRPAAQQWVVCTP